MSDIRISEDLIRETPEVIDRLSGMMEPYYAQNNGYEVAYKVITELEALLPAVVVNNPIPAKVTKTVCCNLCNKKFFEQTHMIAHFNAVHGSD